MGRYLRGLCVFWFAVWGLLFGGNVCCGARAGAAKGSAETPGGAPDVGGGGVFGGIPGVPGVPGNWGGVFGDPFGGVIGGGGVSSPSVICSDPGSCYGKRLTCPSRCFQSAGKSGPKGGGGGAGGGCTMDCKHECRAYC